MKTKIDPLLAKVDRVLDRYLADDTDVTNFARHRAFRWDGARRTLKPISRPVLIHPNHVLGIDAIMHEVLRNTKSFVHGGKANNILLWGERGTGKSSLIKSLLTVFNKTPLRMIQIYRHGTNRLLFDRQWTIRRGWSTKLLQTVFGLYL